MRRTSRRYVRYVSIVDDIRPTCSMPYASVGCYFPDPAWGPRPGMPRGRSHAEPDLCPEAAEAALIGYSRRLTVWSAASNVRGWPSRARARWAERLMPPQSKWQSLPTEQINPASLAIDKTAVRDIIELVINEDRKVLAAVQKEKEKIAHGVEIIAQSLRKGGRVIFIGAGTSGRLGVVEAAEMPP